MKFILGADYLFKECLYIKIYFQIVDRSKIRITNGDSIYESHHIIPSCFYLNSGRKDRKRGHLDGNPDSEDNLVLLTLREHYICHKLLTKMMIESYHMYRMVWALHLMTYSGKYNLTSRQYETMKKLHSENIKTFHPSKTNPNWLEEHSVRIKKSYESNPELAKLRGEIFKKYWANVENKERSIEHNRKNAKLGGIASAKKTKGTKRPGTGFNGNTNPQARRYEILEPDNNIIFITSEEIKSYCDKVNISFYSIMKNGRSRGYSILSRTPLNRKEFVDD